MRSLPRAQWSIAILALPIDLKQPVQLDRVNLKNDFNQSLG
ncbi:hypothetical protein [Coleofasciculus sp. H7-2]